MEYLVSVLVLAALVIVMWALGRKLLGLCGFRFAGAAENFVFSFAAGFGIVSYLILLLGMLKFLYAPVAAVLLLFLAALCLPEMKKCLGDIPAAFIRRKDASPDLLTKTSLCLLAAVTVMALFGALSPSYSNDSMVYHLTDAKYFAENHAIGLIPGNSTNSLWPYLVEMYYTLALLFGLFPLAGLFHFLLAAASALGVYAFAGRFFSKKAGILSAAVFFLTPAVFVEAAQTYVDLGTVFYVFTAFYAFILYLESKALKWAALCGVMCGLGMSVKYFAALVPAILGVWMLADLAWGVGRGAWGMRQSAERRAQSRDEVFAMRHALGALLLFCVFTALFSCVWYVRQWIVLGNPFFPFFAGIFGGGGLDAEVIKLVSEESIRASHGMMVGLKSFLTLPWRMAMFPAEFGGEHMGPLFLAVIPGAVLLRDVDRELKRVSIFALAYIAIWFVQYQHMRFFLPAVPFLSIIAAYVLTKVIDGKKAADRMIVASVTVLFAFSLALAFYHNFSRAQVVLGLKSANDHLAANERSFEVSELINKDLPAGAKVMVVNEAHTFFIDKPHKRELYWWIWERYDKKCGSSEEVISSLKLDGFSHILYARFPDEYKGPGTALSLTELMKDAAFREKYLRLIHTDKPRSKNANGVEYGVYEIK